MNHSTPTDCIASFIQGDEGNLYSVYYPPKSTNKKPRHIIYIPPFAEESNRCRAMTSIQARALSNQGIGVFIMDLFGTGDSAGNFVDGNWKIWQSDIISGIHWLKKEYNATCDTLWATRLGAMLAIDVAAQTNSINNLILWQPVINGKSYLTQFLRIRIAAELASNNDLTTKKLRQQFADGESVEISGYEISPELALSIDQLKPSKLSSLKNINIDWFEVYSTADIITPLATKKAIEECKKNDTPIALHQVNGPAFWQLHDRFLAPELIEATTKVIYRM